MTTEAEIRDQLANYLAGEWSLDAFDEWFTGASWNIQLDSDEAAKRLAYAIELRLAKHSSSESLTDEWLRKELAALLGQYSMRVYLGAVQPMTMTTTSSSARTEYLPRLVAA